jgi:subtilase family serine protease
LHKKIGQSAIRAAVLTLCLSFAYGDANAAPVATEALSAVPATQQLEFQVILPLQNRDALHQLIAQQHDSSSANYHHWLTPTEFKARFGANPDSVARVVQHLQRYGVSVVQEHAQGLRVRGDASAVSAALGISLHSKTVAGVKRVMSDRSQTIRAELRNEGAMVSAFVPVTPHQPHSRNVGTLPTNRYGAYGAYWFTDLKEAYDYPAVTSLNGHGATVAIVMASDVQDSDTALVFNHENWTSITGLPVPTITREPILGGAAFSTSNDASFEASLDVQQVLGMAPGANVILYNIPDLSDNSILTAYQQVVTDNKADVVSSSFGGPEDLYTAAYNQGTDYTYILQAYEQLFEQGNAQGITFVASSGDNGGLAVPSVGYFYGATSASYQPGVETPAVSPSVTGVGGTNLQTVTGQGLDSAYVGENAYGDPEVDHDPYGVGINVTGGYWGSGGGVSKVYSQPQYQKLLPTGSTMRTVPDIGVMEGGCPGGLAVTPCAPARSAVAVAYNGGFVGAIGTSVSAPDFAGALALAVQNTGTRLGNVNYLIYQKALLQSHHIGVPVFHTNIAGFNGAEYTAPVYNQVIGVGTPDVRLLINAAKAVPSGTPQTPSNP